MGQVSAEEHAGEHEEQAAAYALDALEAGERREFESHLAAGCGACARSLSQLRTLASALPARASADVAPRVRRQVLDLAELPALPIDPAEVAWEEPIPGIRLHVLREEPGRGLRACLVTARAGARVPRHRHGGDEIIYVIEGSLRDDSGVYGPGQVCHSREGSEHSEEAVEDCLCYVLYYGELQMLAG